MANTTPNLPTPTSPAAARFPSQKIESELLLLELDLIAESTTNPRLRRNPEADKELTESIRLHGVLQPVLVRRIVPNGKTALHLYELVAGSRRFRAAKDAGLITIPANVRKLTDEQALELQIIENLQREDIAPIEEGRGYTALLAALAKKDPQRAPDGQGVRRQDLVVQIAQKVGKSARYVYARMKLCELIPELQKDLDEGRIEASHADELVRLTPHDQKEIRDSWGSCLYMDERVEMAEGQVGSTRVPRESGRSISVRNLKTIIERDYQLTLDKAKFDTKDPGLKPGSCFTCPKNTGVNPLLPPAKQPTCTDKECWRNKMRQHVEAQARELAKKATNKELVQITLAHYNHSGRQEAKIKARPDWKSAKPGECKNVQPAVQVEDAGGVIHSTVAKTVCTNKSCKVHWGATPSHGGSSSSAPKQNVPTLEELRRENKERLARFIAHRAPLELMRRTLAKVDKLSDLEVRLLVNARSTKGWFDQRDLAVALDRQKKPVDARQLVKDAKAADLPRILLALEFCGHDGMRSGSAFEAYAKARGINAAKVKAEFAANVETCVICGCIEEHGCHIGGNKRCAWVVDDRLRKVGLLCSNPLCVAEAKKRAGIKEAPAKKAVQASAKPKAKAAKGGRA